MLTVWHFSYGGKIYARCKMISGAILIQDMTIDIRNTGGTLDLSLCLESDLTCYQQHRTHPNL